MTTFYPPRKLGLCIPHQNREKGTVVFDASLELFKPAWYYDHKFDYPCVPGDGYVRMAFEMDGGDYFGRCMREASLDADNFWLVGNEPEMEDQGLVLPAKAAKAMRRWVANTSNPFAVPGVLFGDHGGSQWVVDYVRAGGPIPDFWHIHLYAHSGGHWKSQWELWKHWLKANNVPERPTIVSECGSWSQKVVDQIEVMDVVVQTLRYDEMLVSAAWFSSHYSSYKPFWSRSDLLDKDCNLTLIGEHFRDANVTPGGLGIDIHLPFIRRN